LLYVSIGILLVWKTPEFKMGTLLSNENFNKKKAM